MNLPAPPNGLRVMSNLKAAAALAEWLRDVALLRGEAGLNAALTLAWPGSKEQRALLTEVQISAARREAIQRTCREELT